MLCIFAVLSRITSYTISSLSQQYLLGMNCDSFLPHDEMNEKLRKDYGNVQFAHDGLELDLSLEKE
jgi:hypothetical protein